MTNGEFHLTKEDFMARSEAERAWLLFSEFNLHRQACNARFCRLERRKWIDKAIALAAGAAAGIASAFGLLKG